MFRYSAALTRFAVFDRNILYHSCLDMEFTKPTNWNDCNTISQQRPVKAAKDRAGVQFAGLLHASGFRVIGMDLNRP